MKGREIPNNGSLVFTCCLLQQFFVVFVVVTRRLEFHIQWSAEQKENSFASAEEAKQDLQPPIGGWVGGWLGEWGCSFTRAKHAATPLRILDYGGFLPTAVVKAWLQGALILPEMSATSNIGNKTTWRDKQSWSGPTVTAEGALLFE